MTLTWRDNNDYTASAMLPEPEPTTPPVVVMQEDATGSMTPGTHVIAYSTVTASGETMVGPSSAPFTVDATHTKASVSPVDVGSANRVRLQLYMSRAGTTSPLYKMNPGWPTLVTCSDDQLSSVTVPTANTTNDEQLRIGRHGIIGGAGGLDIRGGDDLGDWRSAAVRIHAGLQFAGLDIITKGPARALRVFTPVGYAGGQPNIYLDDSGSLYTRVNICLSGVWSGEGGTYNIVPIDTDACMNIRSDQPHALAIMAAGIAGITTKSAVFFDHTGTEVLSVLDDGSIVPS